MPAFHHACVLIPTFSPHHTPTQRKWDTVDSWANSPRRLNWKLSALGFPDLSVSQMSLWFTSATSTVALCVSPITMLYPDPSDSERAYTSSALIFHRGPWRAQRFIILQRVCQWMRGCFCETLCALWCLASTQFLMLSFFLSILFYFFPLTCDLILVDRKSVV